MAHAKKCPPSSSLNWDYLRSALGINARSIVHDWARRFPGEFYGKGHTFSLCLMKDSRTLLSFPDPIVADHGGKASGSSIQLTVRQNRESERVLYEITVPTCAVVDLRKPRYSVYKIDFRNSLDHLSCLDDTFSQFRAGYAGVTKRNPVVRFNEHVRDMLAGKGHLFHASWRSLLKVFPEVHPMFQIVDRADTLDEIYEMEEYYVAKYSLAPLGLNAIPGGRAGFEFLGLQSKRREIPTIARRDSALDEMYREYSKSTHYRSGHIRKLPTGKHTWVSPCWVNLGAVA